MMPRPSKYSPEREAKVVEALDAGTSRRGAAEHAGISEDTLERWMRRFAGFAGAVRQAEAGVELGAATAIKAAFEGGDWRAAAWWLERRRSEDWGRRDRLEVIATVRQLAREHNLTAEEEAEAVAEAVRLMQEHARAGRG